MKRLIIILGMYTIFFTAYALPVSAADTFPVSVPTTTVESITSNNVENSGKPEINCYGLPGCKKGQDSSGAIEKVSANIVKLVIQYVAVFAVIALMCSGVLYMVSGGEEEKIKKAKNWIIWSMVGVVLSMSAYYIISTLNNTKIDF